MLSIILRLSMATMYEFKQYHEHLQHQHQYQQLQVFILLAMILSDRVKYQQLDNLVITPLALITESSKFSLFLVALSHTSFSASVLFLSYDAQASGGDQSSSLYVLFSLLG